MSSAKEPPEDGTPASGSGTPAGPEATTRVDAVPAGENGGSERTESGSGASGSGAGSASSDGPAGGTPPPWQRAASAGAGGAAASAGPANAGPAGAPRSAPFPAQGAPRPSPAPHGPPGGARPESGPMPAARPESGAMPTGRPGGAAPGAAAGAPRPGGAAGGGERPASSTALIDAPTNQLSPEQLGMRSDRDERSSDGPGADDGGARAPRGGGGKAPRRASLQVRRFDPWSVLKLALVLGVALFFVWMFAVGVLYAVLDGMGVWAQLNGTYQDLTSDTGGGGGDLITAAGVFGVAAVIGVVNTILFTALASVSAFIYNISADVAGGIEVTLSERD